MKKVDLSIIIVNYNTKKLLKNLLDSLYKSKLDNYKLEVFVVDNSSADGSKEYLKSHPLSTSWRSGSKLKIILNTENLGYARANNKALRRAQGENILLLNSDTLLQKETLFKMLRFMEENQEWVAATCKVELADGRVDPACHRGFPTPWAAFTYFSGLEELFPQSRTFGQYHQTWKRLDLVHEVDVISGAFFLVRKKILDQIGLLDERFFVYAEDIDLCFRIRQRGYKICYNPMTKIIHFKTSSGRKKYQDKKITLKDKKMKKEATKHFFETMKLFYDKHYKDKYPWLMRKMVLLGIWVVSKFKN